MPNNWLFPSISFQEYFRLDAEISNVLINLVFPGAGSN